MGVIDAYLALNEHVDGTVRRDELMAHHTSYRIGGQAALFVTADTYEALVTTLDVLNRESVPWVILGRGTNVLVADEGYAGCVVTLGRDFSRVSVTPTERGALVTAGAGVQLARVVNVSLKNSLAGMDRCVGVPGTLGGAVAMNAGTRHEWIGSLVDEVVTYLPGRGMLRRGGASVGWGYRWSGLAPGEIVLEATLALAAGDHDEVAARMDERLHRRQRNQPVGHPTCGSVFKNPGSLSVGQLLDGCGLKGYRVGGAVVSDVHANFVVNAGGATAADVVNVMRHMYEVVLRRTGVELACEVKFLGFGA